MVVQVVPATEKSRQREPTGHIVSNLPSQPKEAQHRLFDKGIIKPGESKFSQLLNKYILYLFITGVNVNSRTDTA